MLLAMLTRNDWFGEIALLEDTRRTATAKAFEGSLVLSITREKFNQFLKVVPHFRDIVAPSLQRRTANTLKTVEFFKDLR